MKDLLTQELLNKCFMFSIDWTHKEEIYKLSSWPKNLPLRDSILNSTIYLQQRSNGKFYNIMYTALEIGLNETSALSEYFNNFDIIW